MGGAGTAVARTIAHWAPAEMANARDHPAYAWFAAFRDAGIWETLNHHLVVLDRERVGWEASPTAAVIDSQSTKATEGGGPRGYDAGKRVMGRKRHAMVDTDGRGQVPRAHPGNVQDRDGAPPLLRALRRRWPFVKLAFADSGYAGDRVASASPIRVEVVRKPKGQVGFAVHARRWVVERLVAWIGRNRRLAKDFKATTAFAEAFLYAASVMFLLRRVARSAWASANRKSRRVDPRRPARCR